MKIRNIIVIACLSTLALFLSCSNEKNTALRRGYHNLTARYNIYFNGNESYKAGIQKIKQLPENYSGILPVFPEESEAAATVSKSDMDNAVKKSVKLIKMHSITAKPKRKQSKSGKRDEKLSKEQEEFYRKNEYCNWVDDAYLLIGKAHYHIRDYYTGMKSLQLILNKFPKEEIRFDAMYWIARSYSSLGEFQDALTFTAMIRSQENYPPKFNRDIQLIKTDIHIKQKSYESAVLTLDSAIQLTKKRKERTRLQFILAQLYQKLEQGDKAIELYTKVVEANPPYEMVFNAQMNMAQSFGSSTANSEHLKKVLKKMIKDDKNIDYLDQIYYSLGQISAKEGDMPTAVEYYKLSIRKSVSNANQKALSYLALADYYFAKPDYLNAGAYYDSTMTVLDKKYPDYETVSLKASNLSGLITNIRIVNEQDSLQRVARMSENERNNYIAKLINQVRQREAAEQQANNSYTSFENQIENPDNPQNKGNWYFYNPTAIGIGKSEFAKVWGTRKLEDHWRRKNKAVITEIVENTSGQDSSGKITDNKNPKFYLQNLPLNDSLMALSHEKIQKALFAVGETYEKKMNDYPEAVKAYEELLRRYPKCALEIEALFNLYLIHFKHTKNKSEAEKYRNRILNEYPDSKYAKILSDPDYLKKLQETRQLVERCYEEAYTAYKSGDDARVYEKIDEAFAASPNNDLKPKFLFLKASVDAKNGKIADAVKILKMITSQYPKDEIAPRAKDMTIVLESGKYDPDLYKYDENAQMYYVLLVDKNNTALNQIKFKISNFNVEKYPDSDLKTEIIGLSDNKQQVVVKKMSGKSAAVSYINALNTNFILSELKPEEYEHFVISEENFIKLQKLPDVSRYLEFYKSRY